MPYAAHCVSHIMGSVLTEESSVCTQQHPNGLLLYSEHYGCCVLVVKLNSATISLNNSLEQA